MVMIHISGSVQKMSNKKLRPLGDVLIDLEPVIEEMVEDHELEWGDILNLVRGYLEVHYPEAKEVYVSEDSPIYYYGPKEGLS